MEMIKRIIEKMHPYFIVNCLKEKLRGNYYKLILASCGKNVRFLGRVIVLIPKNVFIGDNCNLNEGCILSGRDKISIGNNCDISSYAQIYTGGLNLKDFSVQKNHISKPVEIGEGVWICANSIILPGVKIGNGSVIAAGSVVNRKVPPFEMWAGVPAKRIKILTNCNKQKGH